MTNVVFSFGHNLLNYHSPRITYLVNASLFIYLVHHPLTLIYGAFVTPYIGNNLLGFLLGLLFVFSLAFALYELHKRYSGAALLVLRQTAITLRPCKPDRLQGFPVILPSCKKPILVICMQSTHCSAWRRPLGQSDTAE